VSADSNAIYSNPGSLLFLRENTLLRQPFDPDTQAVSGTPTPIAEQVGRGNGVGAFSVSENGVLVYRAGPGSSGIVQLSWVDRTGRLLERIGPPGPYRGVDLSPDGNRVAVHRHDANGGDVWLLEPGRRGLMSRLTFDATQDNASPIWSPDGNRIAFGSLRNGKWGIYVKSAAGGGTEELLVESDSPKMPMSWSPDGASVVYWEGNPKTSSDQWLVPLSGDKKPRPLLQSAFNEGHPQISPNGRWVAYMSNETGEPEVYVRSFPDGTGKRQVSSGGGTFARWRKDGKELFFLSTTSSGKLMSVKVNPSGSTFEYGDPVALFDSGYINFAHGLNYHTYAVSPDGQRFLIPRPEGATNTAQSTPITVVMNWARAAAR
jgi:eukaryotic-like serine/threonine-protein kinase